MALIWWMALVDACPCLSRPLLVWEGYLLPFPLGIFLSSVWMLFFFRRPFADSPCDPWDWENGEMLGRCWEGSLSPLEKHLLPADPSLQPLGLPFEGEEDKMLLTWGMLLLYLHLLVWALWQLTHAPRPGSGDSNSCPHPRWQVLSPPSRLPSPFLWSFMESLFPDFCLTFHSLEEKFPVSIKSKFLAFVYFLVTVSVNFCPRMWKPKYSMTGQGGFLKSTRLPLQPLPLSCCQKYSWCSGP